MPRRAHPPEAFRSSNALTATPSYGASRKGDEAGQTTSRIGLDLSSSAQELVSLQSIQIVPARDLPLTSRKEYRDAEASTALHDRPRAVSRPALQGEKSRHLYDAACRKRHLSAMFAPTIPKEARAPRDQDAVPLTQAFERLSLQRRDLRLNLR